MDDATARSLLTQERSKLESLRETGSVDETPDPGDVADQGADAATRTFNREIDESLLEQAEADLAEVEAAFQRVEDGTYGTCEIGGEEIPDARLEVQPATRYCVKHQQQVERQAASGGYEGADPTI